MRILGYSIRNSYFIYTCVLPKKKKKIRKKKIQKNMDLTVLMFHIVDAEFAILLEYNKKNFQ